MAIPMPEESSRCENCAAGNLRSFPESIVRERRLGHKFSVLTFLQKREKRDDIAQGTLVNMVVY